MLNWGYIYRYYVSQLLNVAQQRFYNSTCYNDAST